MSSAPLQEVVCCLGQPVAGNPTQYMMEKAFAAAGLDWRYLTLRSPAREAGRRDAGPAGAGLQGGEFHDPAQGGGHSASRRAEPGRRADGGGQLRQSRRRQAGRRKHRRQGLLSNRCARLAIPRARTSSFSAPAARRGRSPWSWPSAASQRITIVNRVAERGQSLVELLRQRTKAAAEFVPLAGDYAIPPDADIFINATSIGLGDAAARVPDRRRFAPAGADRRRRGLQSARNLAHPHRSRTRLPHARRPGHARQPGGHQLSRSGPAASRTPA